MRRFDLILIIIGAALLLLIAAYGVRVAQHYPGARAELARVKLMQLEEGVREQLHGMQHEALITYYVSRREQMASSLRRIERDVADVLDAMKSASGGRLDYQIVYPDEDETFAQHAVHQRVSPFRVRSVSRDSYTERTVWSTLHIAYGPHPAAVVNGVSREHLPRLQSLIMGQIEQKDAPRKPVIGVAAAGPNYTQFRRWIAREARVVDVDLAFAIPDEIDVLFWFDPGDVPPALIRRLNEFLADGRSIVVAGSRHDMRHVDGWAFEFDRTNYDADALLSAFGLRPIDGLVLDQHSLMVSGELAPAQARFMIRCIAHNQDFRAMRNHPNGHLFFAAPTPFGLDGDALAQRGFTPFILATTSDQTKVRDMRYGEARLDWTELQTGDPTPKLPLMVWLRPDRPWQGSAVFSASSQAFRNEWFVHENFAHRRLADVLVETLASDERLVLHRSGIERPQPLPEMSAAQRLFWRLACILVIPALLGVVAWRRGVFRNTTDAPRVKQSTAAMLKTGLPLRIAVGLALVMTLASVAVALGLRADLTQGKLNELSPETRAIAANARDEHALTVNLYFSRTENLPPNMRPMLRQLRATLGEFRRAGADLTIYTRFPDEVDSAERDALEAIGIRPIRSISRDEEVTTVRNIYSTVEFQSGDRRELLHFPDRQSFESLEFRVAFALWRLQTGRTPHIAFIADIPRLSAAEVYHDFQQQNLFAPTGSDVHAHARNLLEQAGFRVTHVNPRQHALPEGDIDLILWMQPRRDILPLLQGTVERLHQGTPVMIAAQHFVMQSRQFSGDAFRMVYWPQPQVADVERFYFPQIGVDLAFEVLFDDVRSAMAIETQVRQTTADRDYGAQVSALPFLIRAIAANYDATHPMTRGLGDQVMPFANHIRLDHDRLESLGLTARPLITSSQRSWTFNWKGGWLPGVLLGDQPRDVESLPEGAALHGRLPLATLIEGRFPLPDAPLTERTIGDERELTFTEAEGEESRLLLIGNSYMFRNERLFETEFRADHLLLNAAAYLALDESLARIAGHRRAAPGFDYIEPDRRLLWRGVVLGAGPAALLLFGMMWWVARSMPSRIALGLKEGPR